MADALKVFKNQVAATKTAALTATTIDIITTTASSQAVLKDLIFSIGHSNPAYSNVYKYPAILKQNGFPIASVASATSLAFTGSQIVDTSSTLTLEIQAESQKIYYGTFKAMMPGGSGTTYYSYDLALLNAAPSGSLATSILAGAKKNSNQVLSTNVAGRSGCAITIGGSTKWCYTTGSTLYIISEDGSSVATYSWPATCNAIVADSTYIYGKSSSSDSVLYRYNYTTLSAGTNLSLNGSVPGYGTSNKGFVDSYNGFMYIKINGSDAAIYKINLTTGVVSSISCGLTQTETLGGCINVNTSGVPYIVTVGDQSYELLNLNTLAYSTYTTGWPTDPTTTSGNNVLSIANGLILANNGSYGSTAVIDINGATPTSTITTSTLSLGAEGTVFIGLQFQTAPATVNREMVYNLLATGVEVTI